MHSFSKVFTALVSVFSLFVFSNQASAFAVWAVEGGADASSNFAGNILTVAPGTQTIDLYFDTEGDTSWGWDITLDVAGTGLIFNVLGGDINGNLGAATASGWQQLGGNAAVDLVGSSILLFSFSYDTVEGDLLSLLGTSSYTSGTTFGTEAIPGAMLVQTSAVPLPAAGWLMMGALGLLGGARKFTS